MSGSSNTTPQSAPPPRHSGSQAHSSSNRGGAFGFGSQSAPPPGPTRGSYNARAGRNTRPGSHTNPIEVDDEEEEDSEWEPERGRDRSLSPSAARHARRRQYRTRTRTPPRTSGSSGSGSGSRSRGQGHGNNDGGGPGRSGGSTSHRYSPINDAPATTEPLHIGWPRSQATRDPHQRQAVYASLDARGRINYRVHTRNSAGETLQPHLRTAASSIMHESVELRPNFYGMTHQEIRQEVARMSRLFDGNLGHI